MFARPWFFPRSRASLWWKQASPTGMRKLAKWSPVSLLSPTTHSLPLRPSHRTQSFPPILPHFFLSDFLVSGLTQDLTACSREQTQSCTHSRLFKGNHCSVPLWADKQNIAAKKKKKKSISHFTLLEEMENAKATHQGQAPLDSGSEPPLPKPAPSLCPS